MSPVVMVEVKEEETNLSSSRGTHKCKSHMGSTGCRRDDLGKQVLRPDVAAGCR
jgi:hypothetical protein